MDVCVWVSVCVHGWVAKDGILSSASLTNIRVFREFPLLVYFGAKTTQSAIPREPAIMELGVG